jgi:hypothetical protein
MLSHNGGITFYTKDGVYSPEYAGVIFLSFVYLYNYFKLFVSLLGVYIITISLRVTYATFRVKMYLSA